MASREEGAKHEPASKQLDADSAISTGSSTSSRYAPSESSASPPPLPAAASGSAQPPHAEDVRPAPHAAWQPQGQFYPPMAQVYLPTCALPAATYAPAQFYMQAVHYASHQSVTAYHPHAYYPLQPLAGYGGCGGGGGGGGPTGDRVADVSLAPPTAAAADDNQRAPPRQLPRQPAAEKSEQAGRQTKRPPNQSPRAVAAKTKPPTAAPAASDESAPAQSEPSVSDKPSEACVTQEVERLEQELEAEEAEEETQAEACFCGSPASSCEFDSCCEGCALAPSLPYTASQPLYVYSPHGHLCYLYQLAYPHVELAMQPPCSYSYAPQLQAQPPPAPARHARAALGRHWQHAPRQLTTPAELDAFAALPIEAEPSRSRQAYGMNKVWQDEFDKLFAQFDAFTFGEACQPASWTLLEVESNPRVIKSHHFSFTPNSCTPLVAALQPLQLAVGRPRQPPPRLLQQEAAQPAGDCGTVESSEHSDVCADDQSLAEGPEDGAAAADGEPELSPSSEPVSDGTSCDDTDTDTDTNNNSSPEPLATACCRQQQRRFPSRLRMFIDSAKVRFCCDTCGHGWTSMKGRVVFWYELFEVFLPNAAGSQVIGYCTFKLFGQQCDSCKLENTFERPMWYPEEVRKVLANLCNKIGQLYLGFKSPSIDKQRRAGKPKTSHNSSLCQACFDGVCTDRK